MERKYNKIPKLNIRKGDTVKVLSGDDKGKSGKVLLVNVKDRKAIVEGVNLVTKHKKPDAENPNGSIAKIEAAMHISKLQLLVGGETTRVGRKRNDAGKLQRYSKKSGEFIK
jgi:large subunit ribosomal protein L24